jgi:hypothetical protein
LLGADGKVLGVTSLGWLDGQNLNFAVPASQVKWLLLQAEAEASIARLPLSQQAIANRRNTARELDQEKEANLVQRIKSKLLPGMTSRETVSIIVREAKEVNCKVGWSEKQTAPHTFLVRYFPFEVSRGPGQTGLGYRLNVIYLHDRLHDWYVQEN